MLTNANNKFPYPKNKKNKRFESIYEQGINKLKIRKF